MNPKDPSPGEARLHKRQRAQVINLGMTAMLGGLFGFLIAFFDQSDGNLLAGDWELKLSPAFALLLAVMSVVIFLVLPLRELRKADDYQRDLSLKAFAGGWIGATAGYPAWAALYGGGFVPAPNAFGLFAIAYISMILSFLYARWRL